MKRRARILMGVAVMALATSGCTVLGPYQSHGYPGCYLQFGPGDAPNLPQPSTVFPILGDVLWEICFLAD